MVAVLDCLIPPPELDLGPPRNVRTMKHPPQMLDYSTRASLSRALFGPDRRLIAKPANHTEFVNR